MDDRLYFFMVAVEKKLNSILSNGLLTTQKYQSKKKFAAGSQHICFVINRSISLARRLKSVRICDTQKFMTSLV